MSDDKDFNLILFSASIVGEGEYRLRVSGLPDIETTREFARKLAAAAAGILSDVMGEAPTGVAAAGRGATDEVRSEIEKALGTKMTPEGDLPQAVRELAAALAKDDCQCPGCVARRAHDAKIEAGSISEAKH